MTFWQAYWITAKNAAIGVFGGCLIGVFLFVCVWLTSAGRYIAFAVFAVVVVLGTLAAFARSSQRSVELEQRKWRALGFGKHEP